MTDEQAFFKVSIPSGAKEAEVTPARAFASRGNPTGIVIENGTNARIWVAIPAGVTDTKSAKDPVIVHPIRSKNNLVLHVHGDAAGGEHSFPIFCEETFSNAQAKSDPVFIIR